MSESPNCTEPCLPLHGPRAWKTKRPPGSAEAILLNTTTALKRSETLPVTRRGSAGLPHLVRQATPHPLQKLDRRFSPGPGLRIWSTENHLSPKLLGHITICSHSAKRDGSHHLLEQFFLVIVKHLWSTSLKSDVEEKDLERAEGATSIPSISPCPIVYIYRCRSIPQCSCHQVPRSFRLATWILLRGYPSHGN